MTPKEKASYLIALFEITAHPTIDIDKSIAKTHAIKMVNGIIEILEFGGLWIEAQDNTISHIDYWKQVLIDIDNIVILSEFINLSNSEYFLIR